MIKLKILNEHKTLKEIESFLNINDVSIPDDTLYLLFDQMKSNLFYCVEYPYVDRVYRDSYYEYFSSKRKKYNRDCLRISIFNKKITATDFRKKFKDKDKRFKKLRDSFLGFFIIRPITKCVGRNIIDPKALSDTDFFIRFVSTTINLNGVKLTVNGFPHISQDSESMSCAESSIWSILEYFGTRYSQYSTILPSQIKEKAGMILNQKQLPSTGMEYAAISDFLKVVGFNSRTYSKEGYNDDKIFYETLNTYIESGIPVILGLRSERIGHAVIAIGRTFIPNKTIISVPRVKDLSKIEMYDFDSADRNIIIIDDNFPPYQNAPITKPTKYYVDKLDKFAWGNCQIDYMIVPLHNKIYLEAFEAKGCFFDFIEGFNNELFQLNPKRKNYMRFFLTTSRSLKDNLLKNDLFNEELKDIIIAYQLPQFVWIVEISTEKSVLKNYLMII